MTRNGDWFEKKNKTEVATGGHGDWVDLPGIYSGNGGH